MSDWINIATTADFPAGTWQVVDLDTVSILVFNINNEFYAIENQCTHDGGSLADGALDGDEIICPRHGARFCVRTGAVTAPPAFEDVPTFPVRVVDNMIQVRDNRDD